MDGKQQLNYTITSSTLNFGDDDDGVVLCSGIVITTKKLKSQTTGTDWVSHWSYLASKYIWINYCNVASFPFPKTEKQMIQIRSFSNYMPYQWETLSLQYHLVN